MLDGGTVVDEGGGVVVDGGVEVVVDVVLGGTVVVGGTVVDGGVEVVRCGRRTSAKVSSLVWFQASETRWEADAGSRYPSGGAVSVTS